MNRYIDADALIKTIEKRRFVFKDTITVAEALLAQGRVIREEIDNAPTADVVEVKYGEWVYGEYDIPHCSECGYEPKEISPFCPNCGTKMDGERRAEE